MGSFDDNDDGVIECNERQNRAVLGPVAVPALFSAGPEVVGEDIYSTSLQECVLSVGAVTGYRELEGLGQLYGVPNYTSCKTWKEEWFVNPDGEGSWITVADTCRTLVDVGGAGGGHLQAGWLYSTGCIDLSPAGTWRGYGMPVLLSEGAGGGGDEYGQSSGTSLAAPFIVGLAALYWSQVPDVPASDVRRQLRRFAQQSYILGEGDNQHWFNQYGGIGMHRDHGFVKQEINMCANMSFNPATLPAIEPRDAIAGYGMLSDDEHGSTVLGQGIPNIFEMLESAVGCGNSEYRIMDGEFTESAVYENVGCISLYSDMIVRSGVELVFLTPGGVNTIIITTNGSDLGAGGSDPDKIEIIVEPGAKLLFANQTQGVWGYTPVNVIIKQGGRNVESGEYFSGVRIDGELSAPENTHDESGVKGILSLSVFDSELGLSVAGQLEADALTIGRSSPLHYMTALTVSGVCILERIDISRYATGIEVDGGNLVIGMGTVGDVTTGLVVTGASASVDMGDVLIQADIYGGLLMGANTCHLSGGEYMGTLSECVYAVGCQSLVLDGVEVSGVVGDAFKLLLCSNAIMVGCSAIGAAENGLYVGNTTLEVNNMKILGPGVGMYVSGGSSVIYTSMPSCESVIGARDYDVLVEQGATVSLHNVRYVACASACCMPEAGRVVGAQEVTCDQ